MDNPAKKHTIPSTTLNEYALPHVSAGCGRGCFGATLPVRVVGEGCQWWGTVRQPMPLPPFLRLNLTPLLQLQPFTCVCVCWMALKPPVWPPLGQTGRDRAVGRGGGGDHRAALSMLVRQHCSASRSNFPSASATVVMYCEARCGRALPPGRAAGSPTAPVQSQVSMQLFIDTRQPDLLLVDSIFHYFYFVNLLFITYFFCGVTYCGLSVLCRHFAAQLREGPGHHSENMADSWSSALRRRRLYSHRLGARPGQSVWNQSGKVSRCLETMLYSFTANNLAF